MSGSISLSRESSQRFILAGVWALATWFFLALTSSSEASRTLNKTMLSLYLAHLLPHDSPELQATTSS